MLNKGQVTIGILIMVFVMVIVGVSLILPIASNVEGTRNTVSLSITIAAGAVNITQEIDGSGIVGTVIAVNETPEGLVQDVDYIVASRQPPITSGFVTNTYQPITPSAANQDIDLIYTAEPDGFITSSGGRGIIALVIIFAALAIGVIAIIPAARSGVMAMFGR